MHLVSRDCASSSQAVIYIFDLGTLGLTSYFLPPLVQLRLAEDPSAAPAEIAPKKQADRAEIAPKKQAEDRGRGVKIDCRDSIEHEELSTGSQSGFSLRSFVREEVQLSRDTWREIEQVFRSYRAFWVNEWGGFFEIPRVKFMVHSAFFLQHATLFIIIMPTALQLRDESQANERISSWAHRSTHFYTLLPNKLNAHILIEFLIYAYVVGRAVEELQQVMTADRHGCAEEATACPPNATDCRRLGMIADDALIAADCE